MDTLNFLLEITVYSGVIFLVTLLVKKCFAKKMSPFLHYAVWALLVARLMMPFTVSSPVRLVVVPATVQYEAAGEQAGPRASLPAAPAIGTVGLQETATAAAAVREDEAAPLPAQPPEPKPLSWADILLIVWVSGIGAGLLYLVCGYSALYRRIRKSAESPSRRLMELFEEAKVELGIKAHVKLVCLYRYGTPALIFPGTVLMPIDALVSMDEEQVKYALRHELMHFKHGDHMAILLLSVLNAVYWFNPFVWLAVRKIHADMETACDGAVAGRLDDAGRSAYAGLIVELFSRPKRRQPVLGLAGRNTKRAVERRIEGIFMKSKSVKSVRIVCSVLAVLLFGACFTTACRPAAGTAVAGAASQKLLAKAISAQDAKGSLKERLQAPDRFQADLADGKIKVAADADIVLPDAEKIPITRVEGQPFERQTVINIKDILMDTSKFYDPDALSRESKSELNIILEKLKQRRAELKKQGMQPLQPELDNALPGASPVVTADNDPAEGEASMAAYNQLDQVNESIISIQNMLQNAPEQRVLKEVPGELKTEPVPAEASDELKKEFQQNPLESFYASQLNPKGGMRTLQVYIRGRDSTLEFVNRRDYEPSAGYYSTEAEWEASGVSMGAEEKAAVQAMPFPPITPEGARETADRFLKQAGIDYLSCEREDRVIGGSMQSWGDDTIRRGNVLKGYKLEYVRKVGGVPLTYTDADAAFGDGGEEDLFWAYEKMTFVIDGDGIAELIWHAPYRILNTVTDNAAMLTFPQIEEIFKQKIVAENAGLDMAGLDIGVNEVRLGLMRVVEKGNAKQGLLIPVWDFFGSFTQYIDDSGKRVKESFGTANLLTINAIDGSVIDRIRGTIG